MPLPAPVVDELRAHKARQAAERLAAGPAWRDLGAVFATETGGYLEPRNVLRRCEKIAHGAGLPGIWLHTLRHSAASALIESGTPMKVQQELLGHSSFSITADIYSTSA
ncbi:MAG: tyrosine-type recombinase/integrase [Actinomycetota bacterium]|nr:tyrosine-type recombinase/integrase [Actinomycetota bacterium]